jgi:hypothetical protein
MPVHSRGSDYYPTSATFALANVEVRCFDEADTQSNFVLTARLVRSINFGSAVASVKAVPRRKGGSSMTFSLLHRWKEPTTRCSICGWSVTLELSKTDEGGKAVHESCYVRRTLSKFRKPIDELPQSWPITAIDPVRTASEPALAGIHWRIFGLIRL